MFYYHFVFLKHSIRIHGEIGSAVHLTNLLEGRQIKWARAGISRSVCYELKIELLFYVHGIPSPESEILIINESTVTV